MRASAGLLLLASLATGDPIGAQDTSDGALFLLFPAGARTIGQGQATVASETGSEAVWSNPASLARQTSRETAIHHSTTLAVTGDAITFVAPAKRVGVFAFSINIFNLGDQQITEGPGSDPVGLLLPRNVIYAATFARPVGRRFNGGFTYKLVQARIDCTGQCGNIETGTGTTHAFDVGAQYRVSDQGPLVLGAAVRSVGGDLQATPDEPPSKLPRRVQLGAEYRLNFFDQHLKDTEIRVAGEVEDGTRMDNLATRIGGVIVYQKRVHLRAGYVSAETDASGPSIGFGLVAGKLAFDIARTFEGLSADAGEPPTFFSLRYVF